MRTHLFLLVLLIASTQPTAVIADNGDGEFPSKPTLVLYSLLFFLMNTLQEIIDVVIFAFIWAEFFKILELLGRRKE